MNKKNIKNRIFVSWGIAFIVFTLIISASYLPRKVEAGRTEGSITINNNGGGGAGVGWASTTNDTNSIYAIGGVNGGNVGVGGTTTPFGFFSISATSTASNAAKPFFVVASSTNSNFTTLFILKPNGNLGVGSSTPFATLSISTPTQQDGSLPLFSVASTTNSNLFIVLGNGNVGIGTTSPYANLSISGNAGQSGNLAVISTTTSGGSVSNAITVNNNGYFGILTQNPTSPLTVNGQILVSGGSLTSRAIEFSTGGGIESPASSDIVFSNAGGANVFEVKPGTIDMRTSDVAGATSYTESNTGSASQTAIRMANSQGTGLFAPSVSGANSVAVSSNSVEVARFDVSGNVGIGTTTPAATLSVATSSPLLSQMRPIFIVASTTGALSQNLFTVNGTGNVAIGTSSPTGAKGLVVNNGDIFVATSTGLISGVITQASDQSCHRIVVSNSNTITASTVTCPF